MCKVFVVSIVMANWNINFDDFPYWLCRKWSIWRLPVLVSDEYFVKMTTFLPRCLKNPDIGHEIYAILPFEITCHIIAFMFLADIVVWTRCFVGASTMRDVTAKVVILGDSGVGKTSYAQRYVSGHFLGNYKFTVGGKSAGVTRITMDELNSLWLSDI